MADLAITSVKLPNTQVKPKAVQLGETCSAYDLVYFSSGKYYLANCVTDAASKATHILMEGGIVDDIVVAVPLSGSLTLGTTMTVAVQYCVSQTSGKAAPRSDLISNDFVSDLWVASSATVADMQLDPTGIQVP